MSKAVLLIIDVVHDFFREGPLAARRPELTTSINALVGSFRENAQPVIWVRQEFKADLSDAFLEMRAQNISITIAGTEGAQMLAELDVQPRDTVIVKKRYSAFFGTELDEVVSKLAPDMLVVCGVNTHACVRTTVIDAYQRDYRVLVASECTASRDEKHHEITKQYLDGGIARFLTNHEIRAVIDTSSESATPTQYL